MKLFVKIGLRGLEVEHSKIVELVKHALPSFAIELGYFDPSKDNNDYQLVITSFEIDDDNNFFTTVNLCLYKQGEFRNMEIEISQKTKVSEKVFFILFKELLDVLRKSEAINKIA